MGALAQRLTTPAVVRCKYADIVSRLDDDDRAALAEFEAGYHDTNRRRGLKHGHSPKALAKHLYASKIIVSEFSIRRHFDGDCRCSGEDT